MNSVYWIEFVCRQYTNFVKISLHYDIFFQPEYHELIATMWLKDAFHN
jgi:hypothetical protein